VIKLAKLMFGIAAACFLTGCCSVSGQKVLPDGSTLSIKSTRWFWSTEGLAFSVTDSNGFTTTLSTQKSSVDVAAINAVIDGMIQAAAKAAVK